MEPGFECRSDLKTHSLVIHIPYLHVVSEVSRAKAWGFFFPLKWMSALQLLLDSFIHLERAGYWKTRVREWESVLHLHSFISPAGSIDDPYPFHIKSKNLKKKVRMWSGVSVFLFLLIVLAEIKNSVSPFSPICRFLLLNSIRKLWILIAFLVIRFFL